MWLILFANFLFDIVAPCLTLCTKRVHVVQQLDYLNCTYTVKSIGLRMRTHQEEHAKKKIRGM